MIRNLIFGAVAIASLGFAGCGGFSCDADSNCSGDDKASQSTIDKCQEAIDGDCGTEIDASYSCFFDNQVCTSDDKTDLAKMADKCKTESAAVAACCKSKPSAAGCPKIG